MVAPSRLGLTSDPRQHFLQSLHRYDHRRFQFLREQRYAQLLQQPADASQHADSRREDQRGQHSAHQPARFDIALRMDLQQREYADDAQHIGQCRFQHSTVAGFSDNRSALTIGMTTAEEVFPRVTPRMIAASGDNPSVKSRSTR